ncbi:DNA-processing protein DprA [Clostridium sp. MD294]|uniref:DNA-processing protein DprA n=1 Tax=Clostridium sp. MD294 TaxID=97138 RepID=UPI0002CA90D2|nr:DNA-processing protein DprA [Clostridium sp. MD294]USF30937.1 hypothetical protein C820_002381 [Clostridium sp. MD294]
MEEYYMMWLSRIPSIGVHKAMLLLDYFGTAEEIWKASFSDLREVKGIGTFCCHAIKEAKKQTQLEKWIEELEEKEIRFVSIKNEQYPYLLKQIYDPPIGFYMRGYLPDDNIDKVSIVGARRCSHYGASVTYKLANDLAKANITVVSGMATGIDGIAHKGVLDGGGQTIAVLGTGVDICYPVEHKELMERIIQNGCVISEYPPNTPVYPQNFPKRNRIISGLSAITIVVEAGKKSGTLITADQALNNGREVFVVPGNVTSALSEGTNNLIKQGCPIITEFEDVLVALGIAFSEKEKQQFQQHMLENMKKEEKEVYDCIGQEAIDVETISRKLKREIQEVQYSLTLLEIMGRIRKLPQSGYIREY